MNKINLHLGDSLEALKKMPDNAYDLAIVDPPYGIDVTNQSQGKGGGVARKIDYIKKDWDKSAPNKYYFEELMRVSVNQVIWGANHFISRIPYDSSCWVIWDKDNGATDFADCELAWTSFNTAARKLKWKWSGMLQQDMKNKETRIHPTQKPVKLYEWLLDNYAKEGDTILDTHLGSGSIALACHNRGFSLDAYEIDNEYYLSATNRLKQHQQQLTMF